MTHVLERPGAVLGIAALVLNNGASDEQARSVIATAVESGVIALDTARSSATYSRDADALARYDLL